MQGLKFHVTRSGQLHTHVHTHTYTHTHANTHTHTHTQRESSITYDHESAEGTGLSLNPQRKHGREATANHNTPLQRPQPITTHLCRGHRGQRSALVFQEHT